jgi:hypothetical protein
VLGAERAQALRATFAALDIAAGDTGLLAGLLNTA